MTTAAQKRAQARYDRARPPPISVRLTGKQLEWIDARRQPGESLSAAVRRLAIPDL